MEVYMTLVANSPIELPKSPGNLDPLNLRVIYPSDGIHSLPELHPTPLSKVPAYLIPYRLRVRSTQVTPQNTGVHFFRPDRTFESAFARPQKAWQFLDKYEVLLSPDFSIYPGMPLPLELFNIYRNRWCARYWQERGKFVIPTIRWTTPDRYQLAFEGIPKKSIVATSAVGVNTADLLVRAQFINGYREMVKRLRPQLVLFYGPVPFELWDVCDIAHYPYEHWSQMTPSKRADTG